MVSDDIESKNLGPILVVDDDKITRRMVVKHLKNAGYQVIQAENGRQGLEAFETHQPAMLLTDVEMPEMDGFELCQQLREQVTDLALPIIMLTGRGEVESVDQAFRAGATDFINKPINWPLLEQRVRYALRYRQMYLDTQQSQQRLREAQRIAKMGHGIMNLTTGEVTLSKEVSKMIGLSGEVVITAEQFKQLLSSEDQKRMDQEIAQAMEGDGGYSFEHHVRLPSGDQLVIMQRGEIRQEHGQRLVYGTLQDITEQARSEERIRFHTYYDVLTDLPNRVLFEKQLAERLANGTPGAMIFIGLDRFKSINDSLGHHAGDLLLQAMAKRLSCLQEHGCLLARFGGDLFAAYSQKYQTIEQLEDLAQEILTCIEEPFNCEGHELLVHGSLGIALYPQEAESSEKLLLGADIAMNLAKEHGGNQYRYFSSMMDQQAQQRLSLEQDMRIALSEEQFEVYYQPQFSACTQEIIGMEALVRWNHPEKGLISPGLFIPLAEETGMVIELGAWVLENAIEQTVKWHKQGFAIRLGVNLSAKQLALPDFDQLVATLVARYGIAPELLELEITESMAVGDYDSTIETLNRIRALGVQTSMDDFGTGYSSLSYLQKLPLNTLKIDRAFIKDITDQGENGEIARAIIALSESLGLHIIAEGIETKGQFLYLRNEGADEIQGFYFSKPLPVGEFDALLKKNRKDKGVTG